MQLANPADVMGALPGERRGPGDRYSGTRQGLSNPTRKIADLAQSVVSKGLVEL